MQLYRKVFHRASHFNRASRSGQELLTQAHTIVNNRDSTSNKPLRAGAREFFATASSKRDSYPSLSGEAIG